MGFLQLHPQLVYVRFEQGRGKGGVPKAWIEFIPKATLDTLIRQALEAFRAYCLDENVGHGKDLMPGRFEEYQLHNVDGGRVEKPEDIRWEGVPLVQGQPQHGTIQRAELVLTWKNPAEELLLASR